MTSTNEPAMADLTFPTLDPTPTTDDGLLRAILRENAVFSLTSGAILAVGSPGLDTWFGVNAWILAALGVALMAYSVMLWAGAGREETLEMTGQTAIAGDIGWLIGAIALISTTGWLTRNGEIVLALVSVPVALFALGQSLGLRRLKG